MSNTAAHIQSRVFYFIQNGITCSSLWTRKLDVSQTQYNLEWDPGLFRQNMFSSHCSTQLPKTSYCKSNAPYNYSTSTVIFFREWVRSTVKTGHVTSTHSPSQSHYYHAPALLTYSVFQPIAKPYEIIQTKQWETVNNSKIRKQWRRCRLDNKYNAVRFISTFFLFC